MADYKGTTVSTVPWTNGVVVPDATPSQGTPA